MGARGVFLKGTMDTVQRAWCPGSLCSSSCVRSHHFQPLHLPDPFSGTVFVPTASFCFFLLPVGFVFSSLPLPMQIISHMQSDLSIFCCWWNSVTVSNNFLFPDYNRISLWFHFVFIIKFLIHMDFVQL